MADVSVPTLTFTRGSTVLDYWLAHAEGLTVEPLGVPVESVVVAPPLGRAEALIVRSPVTRRRRTIPAASIAAVAPSDGHLLLDAPRRDADSRIPRPSSTTLTAAGATVARAHTVVSAGAAVAGRGARAGLLAAASWLRPRAIDAGAAAAAGSRRAARRARAEAVRLAPHLAAGTRTAAATGIRLLRHATSATARLVRWAAMRIGRGLSSERPPAARGLDSGD
jgi:hypothetical protein